MSEALKQGLVVTLKATFLEFILLAKEAGLLLE